MTDIEFRVMADGKPPECVSSYQSWPMAVKSAKIHSASLRVRCWVETWWRGRCEKRYFPEECLRIRSEIAAGTYETAEKIGVVAQRLMEELR